MIASASARAIRNADTTRARLSPTLICSCDVNPWAASCSPIHDEFVSTIWPSNSSVPTATTSTRMNHPLEVVVAMGPPHVLAKAGEGEDHRQPEQSLPEPCRVERGQRRDRERDGELLSRRLDLGDLARRNAD